MIEVKKIRKVREVEGGAAEGDGECRERKGKGL